MKKYRVLILKNYTPDVFKLIKKCFPHEWEIKAETLPEAMQYIPDADIIIPEHAPLTSRLFEAAGNLKIVQTGAGYDSVDLAAASKHGVAVANAPGVNSTDVAEHVFGFIFAWFKKIIRLDMEMKKGEWPQEKTGKTIKGLTIGIIGFGNIGIGVAEIAAALGMELLVYSRRDLNPADFSFKFTQKSFDEILKESDILTLHIPLTDATAHIIGEKQLGMMKKNAFLINTARGGLIDEKALCEALESKVIGGAGLDVFETEPLPADGRLRKLDNIILTPHTAGEPDLEQSYRTRFSFFHQNIQKIIDNKKDAVII